MGKTDRCSRIISRLTHAEADKRSIVCSLGSLLSYSLAGFGEAAPRVKSQVLLPVLVLQLSRARSRCCSAFCSRSRLRHNRPNYDVPSGGGASRRPPRTHKLCRPYAAREASIRRVAPSKSLRQPHNLRGRGSVRLDRVTSIGLVQCLMNQSELT
jgi:hypothetical protein